MNGDGGSDAADVADDVADVAVVVPAYGDADLPARLLRSLDREARSRELVLPVVVCDDASPRPLAPVLDALDLPSLDLLVVRAPVNAGPGAARNRALEQVTSEWVAFLDADMEAGEGWLSALFAAIDDARAKGADVIEGRVDVPAGDASPFTHATEFAQAGSHHGAGNVAHRRAVLAEAGGFDPRFYDPQRGLHFREDSDLYFRLDALGITSIYVDDLVALHPPLPASFRAPLRLARRYYFDPLLAREHPQPFRQMNEARRIGPVSLRRARHVAATGRVAGTVTLLLGIVLGGSSLGRVVRWVGGLAAISGWSATAAAMAWRRKVRTEHVLPLVAVSAGVPWVYVWNYWRGIVHFHHRPRL